MSVCFGRKCTELVGREAGDIRKRAPTVEEEEMSLRGPGWFPRWAPTSELELYQAEAAILNPIRPMISQRTVAGLNTICSLHEKVRGPEKTIVEMHRTITHGQTEVLSQLDADNYTSIVFVHGYAGGVANWLPVWKTFADAHDVYAFDLPGFARSVRPSGKPFKNAQDAINWYIGHFEHWFEAMRIGMSAADGTTRPAGRRIVLVGHSFGGYLCSQFTMRHPEIVDHLILVDAWGVHRHVPPTPEEVAKKKAEQSYTQQALTWAMDGIYWSKLLRGMGPAAPAVFAKARPEFMDTWSPFLDDPQQFYDYTYHCNAQTPHTGERAFGCIRCPLSGPFAAQKPLFLSRHRFPRTRRDNDDSPAPEGTTFHSFTSNCGCPHSPVTHDSTAQPQPRETDDTATTISSGSSATNENPSRPLLGVSDASTLTADERLMLLGRSPTPTPSEFGRDDSPNNVCSPNAPNVGPSSSHETKGENADIGSPPPASAVVSPNRDTTEKEAPFPHHGTPRNGFKLTLLYGSDSWLRSDDVEALCPLLRQEYGTDAHFAMIEKAGHMVMVDNALQFSTEMQKRL